jgi:hypothetical protein
MPPTTKMVRRFTYPVDSPFVSITLYYTALAGIAMLLYRHAPILRPAFTGARLMDMATDGSNIFAPQAPVIATGTLSLEFALLLGVSMIGATLLMLPVAVVYMATRQKKGFDQSVLQTIVILAMAVAGVVVIVRNSLALAFSLAGIVGAVRFRNSLSDTRDTLYIFVSIAIGLAAGVEALPAALMLSIVFSYTVLIFHWMDFGQCDLGNPAGHLLHTARLFAFRAHAPEPVPPTAIAPGTVGTLAPPAHALKPGEGDRAEAKGDGKAYNAVLLVRTQSATGARPAVEQFLAQETKRWALAEVQQNELGGQTVLKYLIRIGKRAEPSDIEDALIQIGAPAVIGARIH